MNQASFSDKLVGKVMDNEKVLYECDKCSKCTPKYFINLNIEDENKYICSYLCSKNMHETYGKNYWDNLVNVDDFNKYPQPITDNKKVEKFKIEISPWDIERLEYHNEMLEEDKRVEALENCSDSSYSDYESD